LKTADFAKFSDCISDVGI